MYTLGHHNCVSKRGSNGKMNTVSSMVRSQQCIPWVIITINIQDKQVIMNTISI